MRLRGLAVLAGLLATLTATAQAHHSFTSFFDLTKTVEISGVVKSVKLVNPHPEMIEHVTPQEYRAPAADLNALFRWLAERSKK